MGPVGGKYACTVAVTCCCLRSSYFVHNCIELFRAFRVPRRQHGDHDKRNSSCSNNDTDTDVKNVVDKNSDVLVCW